MHCTHFTTLRCELKAHTQPQLTCADCFLHRTFMNFLKRLTLITQTPVCVHSWTSTAPVSLTAPRP